MPDGGDLSFSTMEKYFDKDTCKKLLPDMREGEYIEIKITDTGKGIKKEFFSKIFEPFFTTKEKGKGTGLGLAAVYGTVKSHKGVILVNTEEKVGTTFVIYLPKIIVEKKKKKVRSNNDNDKGEGNNEWLTST